MLEREDTHRSEGACRYDFFSLFLSLPRPPFYFFLGGGAGRGWELGLFIQPREILNSGSSSLSLLSWLRTGSHAVPATHALQVPEIALHALGTSSVQSLVPRQIFLRTQSFLIGQEWSRQPSKTASTFPLFASMRQSLVEPVLVLSSLGAGGWP